MEHYFHTVISELKQISFFECLGVITGFLCIYLAAKNHILNWPIAIISIISYTFVFYRAQLYGEIILQIYFLLSAIYGWYFWLKNKQSNDKPVQNLSLWGWFYSIFAVIIFTGIMYVFLSNYTDTNVPLIDGFCTAMSFVAQLLLTRKILQNWLLWLVVDVVYVPLLVYKELYLSSILYFVLVILAYQGYRDWYKLQKASLL